MNNTTDCGFSSLDDVLNQAAADNSNITQLVASCQGVCTLAWGTGNPDLSGIGANISYIVQAIFTIFFGPVFILLCGLKRQLNLSNKVVATIVTLHNTFVDASAQFTIPVSIATIVRIKQDAPLYEIAFLQSLTSMQFLGLLAVIIASDVREDSEAQEPKRVFLLIMYCLMDFGFYMGFVGFLRTSKTSWDQIRDLGAACEGYGRIIPQFTYAKSAHLPHFYAKDFFSPVSTSHFLNNFIYFLLITAVLIAVALAVAIIAGIVWAFTKGRPLILGPASLGLTAGMVYYLVEMERTRNTMKQLTGPEFQDNQWGFGQVISLFLWVPLFIQGIWYISIVLKDDR